MTTARAKSPPASSSPTDAAEIPWYELIPEVPEPPEDGMQQDDVITLIKAILMALFADDPSALVFGPSVNLIYDSAVPGSFIVPDCCVVLGVDAETIRRDRRSYRIDEWGQKPVFALEVASESTAPRDLIEKRKIYALMGAQEYWRLDSTGGDYYGEPLVGEHLVNGEYERLDLHTESNGDIWSRSEVLGVDFCWRIDEDGYGLFLLRDSATGEWLNTLEEEIAAHTATESARQAAEARAQEAEARAQEVEARNQELQAELERLRRQLDRQ